MSSPKVWGPALWFILHTYTERLGNHTNPIMSTDQSRAWINLLKSVEGSIPCARCRAHYKEWRTKYPIEQHSNFQGILLRQKAREWLWGLHDSVNKENGLTSPPIESLSEIYGKYDESAMRRNIEVCSNDFKSAILHSLLNPDMYRVFIKCLTIMRTTV